MDVLATVETGKPSSAINANQLSVGVYSQRAIDVGQLPVHGIL